MSVDKKELEFFSKKYKKKLDSALGKKEYEEESISSQHYTEFKDSFIPKRFSLYEKWCNLSEKTFKISPDKKKIPAIKEAIKTTHLNITPSGVYSFAILFPLLFAIGFIFVFYALPTLIMGEGSLFFVVFAVIVAIIIMIPLTKLPFFFANSWRMKASNQMVLCVFYIVTYMRHTSNMEHAISFAAEHIGWPLSLDLKKVLWDVETQKFQSVKESMDSYLENWKAHNPEFVESMHLIESSLYEGEESRRLGALDKSLNVILDETYEKMLHYAHDLKSPITALHMLGVILPVLGLVILPLATNFVSGVKWYHIFALYNLVLPFLVYYMGRSILVKRPTGYGQTDLEEVSELKKYSKISIPVGKKEFFVSPALLAVFVFGVLFIIGIIPLLMHVTNPDFDCYITTDPVPDNLICTDSLDDGVIKIFAFNEYIHLRDENGLQLEETVGPFGLGATILSMFMVLAFGLALGLYYKLRSGNLIKIRNQSKKLEKEFASALFQLGNRLGDEIPPEVAFNKVASVMQGSISGKFFKTVSNNISAIGLGLEDAIFDPKLGAINQFPSALIESSMKVLIESSKKGPLVASQALINVSEYIKAMHRVDERLRDLMADVISSMQAQISFLAPIITAIVMGMTSMISKIMINISENIDRLSSLSDNAGSYSQILELIGGEGVPTYYFSAIVGLYVVQLTFVLTILVNGIQNGADKLNERYLLGKNLLRSTLLYVAISVAVIILFNSIASNVMSSLYG